MALRRAAATALLRRLPSRRVPPPARSTLRAFCAASPRPGGSHDATHPAAPARDEKTDGAKSGDAQTGDEKAGDEKPGALGGFMRGLMGGNSVAAEDAYAAAAKEEGVELSPAAPQRTDGPSRSELVAMKRRKRVDDGDEEGGIRDRIFSRFSGSTFMRGAFEARERISERIEHSDNPVLGFFRGMYDRVFAENEMAQVIREIRAVDPSFVLSDFLHGLEEKLVPQIIDAYLRADREKLADLCTPEAMQVLDASIRERVQAGVTMDTSILAVSEVELSASRLLEDAPVLIVSFNVQQINCLRDKMGEVVEGKEDEIRAVYYAMAFIQDVELEDDVPTGGGMGAEVEKKDGGPPPWKMMEMVVRGAHSTI